MRPSAQGFRGCPVHMPSSRRRGLSSRPPIETGLSNSCCSAFSVLPFDFDWQMPQHSASPLCSRASAPRTLRSFSSAGLCGVAQTWSDWAPRSIARGSCGVRLWLATLSQGLATMRDREASCESLRASGARLNEFAVRLRSCSERTCTFLISWCDEPSPWTCGS